MKSLLRLPLGGGALLLLASFGVAPAQDPTDPNAVPDGVEIQTRGPVHEAFAQPSDLQPVPGQIVLKEPPAPIPEEPPPERPEGANVQFIPGYWAWEPEDSKFLWVSGGYRNVPIGRQWVPGYWVRAEGGWRWVPGMWAAERQQQLEYVPEPPAPLEVEPTIAAPSDDSTWIPGVWVYRDTRYAWRPGYWSPFRYGRVWAPARYYWTPYGYLFCDGYWDYPWEDRGLLCAPISFYRPVYLTRGWYWRPSYVVNFGLFYDSCFYYPGSFHLYFGNYYGPRYVGYGYRPWFDGYGRYDPVFGYHRWHHGHDRNWYHGQQRLYADRSAGRAYVPPRTFAQQQAVVINKNTTVNNIRAVAPLNQTKVVNQNVNLVRLTATQADTQKALIRRTQEIATTRSQPIAKVGAVQATAPKAIATAVHKLPPLVAGTHSVRAGDSDGAASKKSVGASGSVNDRVTPSDLGIRNITKPATATPPAGNLPKVVAPSGNTTKELRPQSGNSRPAPNINKTPDLPRRQIESSPPRQPEIKLQPAPKMNAPTAPRSFKMETSPRSTSPPLRTIETPKLAPPAPRFETPRNSPSTSRIESPRSSPSTPHMSTSPPPRNSAPSSPRSQGGRGNGKGERE